MMAAHVSLHFNNYFRELTYLGALGILPNLKKQGLIGHYQGSMANPQFLDCGCQTDAKVLLL